MIWRGKKTSSKKSPVSARSHRRKQSHFAEQLEVRLAMAADAEMAICSLAPSSEYSKESSAEPSGPKSSLANSPGGVLLPQSNSGPANSLPLIWGMLVNDYQIVHEPEVGSSLTTSVIFRLSESSSQTTSAKYTIEDRTTTVGIDYAPFSGELIFAPGETEKIVPLTILNPTKEFEDVEQFFFVCYDLKGLRTGDKFGSIVNIVESPEDRLEITFETVSVKESAGSVQIPLRMNHPSKFDTTLHVRLVSSNGPGSSLSFGTAVTIPAGKTSHVISAPLRDDKIDEPNEVVVGEAFLHELISTQADIKNRPQVTVIDDDFFSPEISISSASQLEPWDDRPQGYMRFPVRLSAAAGETVRVNYSTVPGTATAGVDYTPVAGTLEFAPGVTEMVISVPIQNENKIFEGSEQFTVVLSNPEIGHFGANASATGTIVDTDRGPKLSATAARVSEADRFATIRFSLSAPSLATHRISYSTAQRSKYANGAEPGKDYVPRTETVTFLPGQTEQFVTIELLQDLIAEATEEIKVEIDARQKENNWASASASTFVMVEDDDYSWHNFINPSDVNGDQIVTAADALATINALRSAGSRALPPWTSPSIRPPYFYDNNNDGQLTPADAIAVINDAIQYYRFRRGNSGTTVGSGTTFTGGGVSFGGAESRNLSGTLKSAQPFAISDDEASLPRVSIDFLTSPIEESLNRIAIAEIGINLDKASSHAVSVEYSTRDWDATAGKDYRATSGLVTFAPGETRKSIPIEILPTDGIVEGNESFYVVLANPTGGVLGSYPLLSFSIRDQDKLSYTLSNDVQVTESAKKVEAEIKLSTPSEYLLTFGVSFESPSSSRVTLSNALIHIPAGKTRGYFEILIFDDLIDQPDEQITFYVYPHHTGFTLDDQATDTVFVLTIIDNDLPYVPTLSVSDQTVWPTPASGDYWHEFRVSLNLPTTVPVSFQYETVGVTATPGEDFVATKGKLIFAPGEFSKKINVLIKGPTALYEVPESYLLTVSHGDGLILPSNPLTADIVDRNVPEIYVDYPAFVNENSGSVVLTFTATRASAVDNHTIFKVVQPVVGGATPGKDFIIHDEKIVLPAGQTVVHYTIPIINDSIPEYKETIIPETRGWTGGLRMRGPGIFLTIIDDDRRPWHNAWMAYDTNNDSKLTSADALTPINEIRARGSRDLGDRPDSATSYLDVNNDGRLTPADVLMVINKLRATLGIHPQTDDLGTAVDAAPQPVASITNWASQMVMAAHPEGRTLITPAASQSPSGQAVGALSVAGGGSSWQNPNDFRDVNADGRRSAIDALLVLNELRRQGNRTVSGVPAPGRYFDVNGDGYITAADAQLVINNLLRQPHDLTPVTEVKQPPKASSSTVQGGAGASVTFLYSINFNPFNRLKYMDNRVFRDWH